MNGTSTKLAMALMGFLGLVKGTSQEFPVHGTLLDSLTLQPLEGAFITTSAQQIHAISGSDGTFFLTTRGDTLELRASAAGYQPRSELIRRVGRDTVYVGVLLMKPSDQGDPTPDNVLLTAEMLQQSQEFERGIPMLQAGRDVFLNRAAFDFSAAYFRPRGFDSRQSEVYFNGFPLNRLYDGRPSWASLGGLTDIGRNRQLHNGRAFSPLGFGSAGGVTRLRARPSSLRNGFRLTTSSSNRTYAWRQMLTYNSGISPRGHGFLVSGGNRSGGQGFLDGTPYRSRSGFMAYEWKQRSFGLLVTGLYTTTQRGSSAALTRELSVLAGRRYNPYWGYFRGRVRNARKKEGSDFTGAANLSWEAPGVRASLVIGYHRRVASRSRLAYFDAPNPDPAYYRNLPSYYYNRASGVNFTNARLAAEAFKASPQIDWQTIYAVNQNPGLQGKAGYLLTGNRESGPRAYLAARAEFKLKPVLTLQAGIEGARENLIFEERILDMLGAGHHLDRDPFTNTRNDELGPEKKQAGDPVGYRYRLQAQRWRGFLQVAWDPGPFQGEIGLTLGSQWCKRIGLFRNARYPDQSLGPAPAIQSGSWGLKGVLQTRSGARQWLALQAGYESLPPTPQLTYWDPREHNLQVPFLAPSEVWGGSLNLHLRYPWLRGRVSLYLTRNVGGRSVRSYYAKTGFGSGFIREVIGGIGTDHRGVEAGFEMVLSPEVSLYLAGGYGQYTYTENPQLWISTYPGGGALRGADSLGRLEIGEVALSGLHHAAGPEQVVSIGVSYRDPDYWWLDLRANYMGNAYENLSMLRYAPGFERDPETGEHVEAARPEAVEALRAQRPMPTCYLLNLSLGKSWLVGRHYISVFLAFNNLFDQAFVTGGYQQGRLSTFKGLSEDTRSGHPSFGSRYWQGYGRTYFLNIAWSF